MQYIEYMTRFLQKRMRWFVFILAGITIVLLLLLFNPKRASEPRTRVMVGQAQYAVDVADEEKERSQGLSGRVVLGQNEGMLFQFPVEGVYGFWMKDMHFPLDFVWIRDDRVVGLTEDVPPPEASASTLPTYRPPEQVDAVLEINAGQIAAQGIRIGDAVSLQ